MNSDLELEFHYIFYGETMPLKNLKKLTLIAISIALLSALLFSQQSPVAHVIVSPVTASDTKSCS